MTIISRGERRAGAAGDVEKRGGPKMGDKDVYVATVGGMKITEPAIDLAVVLALSSSIGDVALSPRLVSVGEVGLARLSPESEYGSLTGIVLLIAAKAGLLPVAGRARS
ncbi:hypothetical protein GCM10023192_89780 [Amycolatopsis samaneae]